MCSLSIDIVRTICYIIITARDKRCDRRTGDEPEAGEEETSGRADEDEDGTAAQAALEMAGDAPEEIASEEESTAHAHQPENGEEERK